LLRYEGPVPVVVRVARADIVLGKQTISAGDRIFLLLHAANRDQEKFQEPGRIDFSRGKCPHLQFGFGTHLCLGAPLARLEGRVAFDELFRRYSDFEMLVAEIDWRDELMTRGPRELPLRLIAR
jgi:cytochrome P450